MSHSNAKIEGRETQIRNKTAAALKPKNQLYKIRGHGGGDPPDWPREAQGKVYSEVDGHSTEVLRYIDTGVPFPSFPD